MKKTILYLIIFLATGYSVFALPKSKNSKPVTQPIDTATFATGCFWCTEAKFKQLRGVITVTSGFTGGHVKKRYLSTG